MRVALPPLPLQVAATPWPPTLKTVLSVPLVSPMTGLSKVTLSVIVSPALLPGRSATTAVVSAGPTVSTVMLRLAAPEALPAASVARADSTSLP